MYTRPVWRSQRLGLWGALLLGACGGDAVGTATDGTVTDGPLAPLDGIAPAPDATRPDTGVTPDLCDALPRLALSLRTTLPSTEPNGVTEQWDVQGTVEYQGPPTDPSSTWQGELQVLGADGQTSSLLYSLPPGVAMPSLLGQAVHLTFRHHRQTGIYAHAVVIQGLTSGVPPLLFVADVGGMLAEEDPLMSPLRVYRVGGDRCHPEEGICGLKVFDALLFDPSTGGAITQLQLELGESGTLDVFGEPFEITAVDAGHYEDETYRCVDYLPQWVSYVAAKAP